MDVSTIGIIGGGVSGLAAAYELRQNAIATNTPLKIHIFEKQEELGGNAETVVVKLGDWQDAGHKSEPYHRWADLGVNDINLTTYECIARVMKDIGYFDKDRPGKNPNMLPLENTETYFTFDSNILITGDKELSHGVSDDDFKLSKRYNGKFDFWIDVIYKAAFAAVGTSENPNLDITVGAFFNLVITQPQETLGGAVDSNEIINWDDPLLKIILTEIRDYIFYPRISAMYFANDYGPENMCLAAPMFYYKIQEGKDSDTEDKEALRCYFVGGSNRWLQYLLDYLVASHDEKKLVNIDFHSNYAAKVSVTSQDIYISGSKDDNDYRVDRCIITVHADDAARLLSFDDNEILNADPGAQLRSQETNILKILQSITYTRSTAICHGYSGLLPGNRNQWRSYNVLIRLGCSLKPYSMTYLCNRHQNDANRGRCSEYNQVGLPQFFVTLNPQREIPDQYVFRTVEVEAIKPELLEELPQLTSPANSKRYFSRIPAGQPAIAHFKHNLIDKPCFLAQRALIEYHESASNLFFGGGWSNGSGLHEECWLQAKRIAQLIVPLKQ